MRRVASSKACESAHLSIGVGSAPYGVKGTWSLTFYLLLAFGADRRTRGLLWVRQMGRSNPEHFSALSEERDEAARTAILEKVMKGRQPTDLMLRCENPSLLRLSLSLIPFQVLY